MNDVLTKTKMLIEARYDEGRELYEGEARMSQEQQDYYKSLLGDQKAKVSVSRDLGEKDFGSGGGVSVTVTLTCDQSQEKVNAAIGLAYQVSDQAAWHYHGLLKNQLLQTGILKQ